MTSIHDHEPALKHQQVWRRVAGSAGRIGPKVVDPDSVDLSDLADHSGPAPGTLAPVLPVPDPSHAATIAGDARGSPSGSGTTQPRGIKPRAPDHASGALPPRRYLSASKCVGRALCPEVVKAMSSGRLSRLTSRHQVE
jgi:hypothetical protein